MEEEHTTRDQRNPQDERSHKTGDAVANGPKIRPVDTMAALLETPTSQAVQVRAFYPDAEGGGGLFWWDPNEEKQNHNGGTIINHSHQSAPGDTGWYSSTGDGTDDTGTGCWVRPDTEVQDIRKWGAFAAPLDTIGSDVSIYPVSYYAIQAAVDYLSSIGGGTVTGFGLFNIGIIANTVQLRSNVNIDGGHKSCLKFAWGERATGNDDYFSFILNGDAVENVNIKGVTLDANRGDSMVQDPGGGTIQHHCLRIRGFSDNVTIRECGVINSKGFGVWISNDVNTDGNPSNVDFIRNVCEGNLTQSVAVTGGTAINIIGNRCEKDIDLETNNSAGEILRDVIIQGNRARIIKATTHRTTGEDNGYVTITENICEGIRLQNGKDLVANLNTVSGEIRVSQPVSAFIRSNICSRINNSTVNNNVTDYLEIVDNDIGDKFDDSSDIVLMKLKNIIEYKIKDNRVKGTNIGTGETIGLEVVNVLPDYSVLDKFVLTNNEFNTSTHCVNIAGFNGSLGDTHFIFKYNEFKNVTGMSINMQSNSGSSEYSVILEDNDIYKGYRIFNCGGTIDIINNKYHNFSGNRIDSGSPNYVSIIRDQFIGSYSNNDDVVFDNITTAVLSIIDCSSPQGGGLRTGHYRGTTPTITDFRTRGCAARNLSGNPFESIPNIQTGSFFYGYQDTANIGKRYDGTNWVLF